MHNRKSTHSMLFILPVLTLAIVNPVLGQFHSIEHDTLNAFGWFGGDNRSNQGPRHVGIGQSVRLDTAITVKTFAFYFKGPFDFAANPEGKGHEVTLTLNVRDTAGAILKTKQVALADTFSAGWVTWSDIDLDVEADSTLIFNCYLVGAYDVTQYVASYGADATKSYADGVLYGKHGISDLDMESWTDWSVHPSWDAVFRLQSTIRTATNVANSDKPLPVEFILQQNYPNPFNPNTTISFSLQQADAVQLTIFNTLGQTVRTLVNEHMAAGVYNLTWDGRDDAGHLLSSGPYFFRLKTDAKVQTRRMLFVK